MVIPWVAVLIAVNLQTSFLTPPFGFALFYLKGVAPKSIKIQMVYKGNDIEKKEEERADQALDLFLKEQQAEIERVRKREEEEESGGECKEPSCELREKNKV